MNRKVLRLAYVIVGTFMVGCGGGNGTKPDAGDAGKVYPDATVSFDAGSDRKDATTLDTSTDTAGMLPGVGAGSTLIVKGSIDLIGTGTDSCTNQIPVPGDRWCGFAQPAADLANSELWVVNVTKVAAGVAVQCDATVGDPNCVRLSTGLFVDPTNGFRIHGFDGDTLTYSEVPSRGGGSFIGNIFAWRPGWSAPHNLTGTGGMVCNGSAVGTAAVCLENPVADPTGTFYRTAELHAGTLSDKDGSLPLVDTIILRTAGDGTTGVQKWGARLTPDGRSISWSTRATDLGTEDLKWQNVGDDASRVAVASDVDQWIVTSDSQKWLWLKAYNYGLTAAPSGTLQSAPYPGGVAPVTLATNAGDFNEAAAGVFYRSQVAADGTGNLNLAPDRNAMGGASLIDTGVSFVFEVSKDGRNATYTKNIQTDGQNFFFDIYVAGAAATMPCAFTTQTSGFLPPTFLAGGTMAAWGRFNNLTQVVEGVTTTVTGCLTKTFANDILEWTPIGDEGLIYLDDFAATVGVNEASLRYAKVTAGTQPGTGTVVQSRAGLEYAPLLPAMPAVVYTISTNNAAIDGLYINAKLPFTATGVPPAPDGGTDATGASDAGTTGADDAQPGG
jgi:hypothetical protein